LLFFGFLLFYGGGKESKCRPAQGQRMKLRRQIADASKNLEWRPASQTKNPFYGALKVKPCSR
jgi:hypothetical protein